MLKSLHIVHSCPKHKKQHILCPHNNNASCAPPLFMNYMEVVIDQPWDQ